MFNTDSFNSLYRLARLFRVSPVFTDGFGVTRRVAPEALTVILRALGAQLDSPEDAVEAIRGRRVEHWARMVEPVVVSWSPRRPEIAVRLLAGEDALDCELHLEDGSARAWRDQLERSSPRHSIEFEGRRFVVRTLVLPSDLPLGYHQLRLASAGRTAHAWVFRAPAQTRPLREVSESGWGVFLPLYSLHTERSWGAGDFGDLADLAQWTASLGGDLVGTLPLLAAFLDEPCDPSPYTPVSRLFWNEFFVNVVAAPEFEHCAAARQLVSSGDFQAGIEDCRASSHVDYKRQMALKRRVLALLCSSLTETSSQRRVEFRGYVDSRPDLQAYSAFRATTERQGKQWPEWPERLRSGQLTATDADQQTREYHQYVQWLADSQLRELAEKPPGDSAGLYLDLPLGVHPGGFDVWREPDSFALGIAGGAPPDSFFTTGQNWGFAPVHPERIRTDGYRHYIQCLRHHMQYARVLRIDHVMNLHRLYWIPPGFEATDGAYVGYRADEFYAVLALESQRNQTAVIGEDLGTVPGFVRASMTTHAISGMYVGQFQFQANGENAMRATPADSLASLNTHDMRPFAGFWEGLDIDDQEEFGLVSSEEASEARTKREWLRDSVIHYLYQRGLLDSEKPTLRDILEGCLSELASRGEAMMLVNLEDLWLERLPQNTPGTVDQRPNWRLRAANGLEAVKANSEFAKLLERVNQLRSRSQESESGV